MALTSNPTMRPANTVAVVYGRRVSNAGHATNGAAARQRTVTPHTPTGFNGFTRNVPMIGHAHAARVPTPVRRTRRKVGSPLGAAASSMMTAKASKQTTSVFLRVIPSLPAIVLWVG